ncbi:hypothetical protein FLAVO9AF_10219 [Flavobacterium sp. 9AF]|uniref:hypothetical protein n=1 Tax=Flavobacterium sp. 9AF TaxID=2653142 RepID=UPI0012F04843|nr:hypothetical protein [Flavobacterium sp. 9AF]VXA98898.1 hypothetical protein FLAVO9AF_10219 [Flavobacterium sp. 9AF]
MIEKKIDSIKIAEPIKVKIIEEGDKIDWNLWFLLIAVLSLIAAVLIPYIQKNMKKTKLNMGFIFI